VTTLPELLRDADPLGYEPRQSAHDRRLRREAVLNSPRVADDVPRRSLTRAALVALVFIAIVAGGLYWSSAGVDVVAAVRFEVRLAEDNFAPGLREAAVAGNGRRIYVHPETVITNSDIAQAQLVQDDASSMFGVSVTFKADGAERMRRATQGHIGKPLALLIDGTVVMAPVVRSPIAAAALINGNYTKVEAERIVAGIVGR